MLDDDNTSTVNPLETTTDVAPVRRTRRRAASRPAGPPEQADVAPARAEPVSRSDTASTSVDRPQPSAKAAEGATSDIAAKKVTRKAAAKKSARKTTEQQHSSDSVGDRVETVVDTLSEPSVVSEPRKKATKRAASKKRPIADAPAEGQAADASSTAAGETTGNDTAVSPIPLLFQPPDPSLVPTSQEKVAPRAVPEAAAGDDSSQPGGTSGETDESTTGTRRRRSRGGRNRRKPAGDKSQDEPRTDGAAGGIDEKVDELAGTSVETGDDQPQDEGSSRRRRRRHRGGDDSNDTSSDPAKTVVRVRKSRAKSDTPTSVEGSTRIEAKKQRRREGREAGRRRPPILSESEFLARRESVERVMAIRQRGETTQ
nr:hypothetical protein [Propionibacteriales bacterium]